MGRRTLLIASILAASLGTALIRPQRCLHGANVTPDDKRPVDTVSPGAL